MLVSYIFSAVLHYDTRMYVFYFGMPMEQYEYILHKFLVYLIVFIKNMMHMCHVRHECDSVSRGIVWTSWTHMFS